MKISKTEKILILIVFWLITANLCDIAISFEGSTFNNSGKDFLKNKYLKIVDVIPERENKFVIVLAGEINPTQSSLCILNCNIDGQIFNAYEFAIPHLYLIESMHDPNIPVLWLNSTGWSSAPKFWMAVRDGEKYETKMLMKREEEAPMNKCWFFKKQNKKSLFVEELGSKQIGIKDEPNLVDGCWLYCYELVNGELKLSSKAIVAEGKTKPSDIEVECVLINGEVYVWVCEVGGEWSEGLLRIAKWRNDGKLEWTTCYSTKKGYSLTGLTVNKMYGCTAVVLEYKTRQMTAPSAIVCKKENHTIHTFNLGTGFTSKKQIIPINENGIAFLLSGYEGWNIAVLNDKLQCIGAIHPKFRNAADYFLTRTGDKEVYITKLTYDNQIMIEKLEYFSEEQAIGEYEKIDLEKISEKEVEAFYNEYAKGDGKSLLSATDEQLAQDIESGARESISPVISYYRLFKRDEARAKKCLSKQIEMIVEEGVNNELWLVVMNLLIYGELAVNPLLKIAENGTSEQRQIAIQFLTLVPDAFVTDELIKLLKKPDIKKDSITFLAICEKGASTGRTVTIDLLIEEATQKFIPKEDFEATNLLNKSRKLLNEIFRDYEDTPKDWSAESWKEWWKKHCETWKPDENKQTKGLFQIAKEKHRIFQKVAKRLENK